MYLEARVMHGCIDSHIVKLHVDHSSEADFGNGFEEAQNRNATYGSSRYSPRPCWTGSLH
jgi:hypothetical protein